MSRRAALPDAAELFRQTGPAPASPALVRGPVSVNSAAAAETNVANVSARSQERSGTTGRQRHDEKITVYVSANELVDLEQARLTLRAKHGLAPDRGRIVREAIAVVVADLESKGETSALVKRLRGTD